MSSDAASAAPQIDRLEPGTPAPDFTAPTQYSTPLSLSDYRGQWVALYFYPKDHTPGCTTQACNLRDNIAALEAAGVAVVGVSTDDAATHQDFAEANSLPFPLVADPDHALVTAYGVYGERNLYGKTVVGTKRTTYLIDPEGVVRHVFKRPKTKAHTAEILAKLEALR
jgi:peroxiredoxin Q/BCP